MDEAEMSEDALSTDQSSLTAPVIITSSAGVKLCKSRTAKTARRRNQHACHLETGTALTTRETRLELAELHRDSLAQRPVNDELDVLLDVPDVDRHVLAALLELDIVTRERKVEREVVDRSAVDLNRANGDLALAVRLRAVGLDLLLGRDVLLQVCERLAEILVDRLRRNHVSERLLRGGEEYAP